MHTNLLCSWLENSAAFCKLTRGRAGFVADGEVIVPVVVVVVVVLVLADDCNEFSNSNCCTCVMSTYSSEPVAQGRGARFINEFYL